MNQELKAHDLNVLEPMRRAWLMLAFACCWMVGCGGDEAIRIYTAPKEKSLASTGPSEPQELHGALIAKENRSWAFKMMGTPDKVAQYKDDFRKLVDSLAFGDNGEPSWQLPEAWREETGNEFVYRTFRPPNETSFKATISELSYTFNPAELNVPNWQEYVALNINRWREQVSLSRQPWDEMATDLQPIDKLSLRDLPAYYVTLRGEKSVGGGPMGMMGGPMMGGPMTNGPAADSATDSATAAKSSEASQVGSTNDRPPSKSDLQVSFPSGWREVAPLSIMAWKSYEADGPNDTKVQITFTPAGGDSLSNVSRWSGQIGGTEVEAKKAIDTMEKLEVNGRPTELYRVVGPGDNPKATTVAIVPWTGGQSLFVKMSGPAEAVNANNDNFVELLKTIKW